MGILDIFKKNSEQSHNIEDKSLTLINKNLQSFDKVHRSFERTFPALQAWEYKVDAIAKHVTLNDATREQLALAHCQIGQKHVALLENTWDRTQHPAYIKESLDQAINNYKKAQNYAPSDIIANKIEKLTTRINNCDKDALTEIHGSRSIRHVRWEEVEDILKSDWTLSARPPKSSQYIDLSSESDQPAEQPSISKNVIQFPTPNVA